jgi:hypothetical protein
MCALLTWRVSRAQAGDAAETEGGAAGSADKTGGWQTFMDAYGRPYYYQASTNTTSWELPAGTTPAPPPGAAPAAAAAAAPEAAGEAATAMETAAA